MPWSVVKGSPQQIEVEVLVWPVLTREGKPLLTGLPASIQESLAPAGSQAEKGAFTGENGSWLLLPGQDLTANWLLLVGMGDEQDHSLDRIRQTAGLTSARAKSMGATRCALPLEQAAGEYDGQTVARCWVEGAELALFEPGELKSDQKKPAQDGCEWLLIISDGHKLANVRRGVTEGEAYSAGTLLARQLVNRPGNYLTPSDLAKEARRLARREGLKCRILGPAQLEKAGMGGLLGVARGSEQAPRLIELQSRAPTPKPRRRRSRVALVGKGVTFDAGGISLKPPPKMEEMKGDMAGAAAVLGAALTITRLDLPVDLLVIVPATENLPDGKALKPGDVLTMASGKTVEVFNTDAEGRLILADALHYACLQKPDIVIDIATLTGACVLALGSHFAGLLSNSAELIEVLTQAGGETFERVWHLPLIEEHHKSLRGEVADLKNLGPREGGALTAAAFLAEFVADDVDWAHLDIAGPAWSDKSGSLGPKGASGFGSRLLARAVEILVK